MGIVDKINQILEVVVGYVWNIPLVVLLMGSGILFSILLSGIQFKGFKHAIDVIRGKFDHDGDPGEINHFQALTTALSATVGLGNIAGVAVAIKAGGPGATFWMILAGLVGMATKYSECTLAVMYRRVDENGHVHGGPMHYIVNGLGPKFKPLAVFFAFACIASSFGASNMFQTNQVATIMNSYFSIPKEATGIVIAIAVAVVIIGGIKRIGSVTSFLVPFMGGIYILGALIVIGKNIDLVPSLFGQIFEGAFSGTAAAGGFAGVVVKEVLVQGVRRACFSNEAGLGSSPIAHAAASTNEPVREGVVALLEPLVDTVIICTMTALVILISGAWMGPASGVELTAAAFDSAIPGFGKFFVPIAVALFAYSTLLSWSYYGEMATDFLTNGKYINVYKGLFCIFAFVGAIWKIDPVINFSDIMLGLMVVPNLIAVWLLFPKLKSATVEYFTKLSENKFDHK